MLLNQTKPRNERIQTTNESSQDLLDSFCVPVREKPRKHVFLTFSGINKLKVT